MGAPTEYYVDPSLGVDTGSGTLASPWGRSSGSVIQYALDNITRDATNGDRINVKSGAYDTLSANMSFSLYGNGTGAAPLIIQGYSSSPGDGGVGQIDGTASGYDTGEQFQDCLHLVDMEVRDSTVYGDDGCVAYNCYVHMTSSGAGIGFDNNSMIIGCRVEATGRGLEVLSGTVFGNYVQTSSNYAIQCGVGTACIYGNIATVTGTSTGGIYIDRANCYVYGNTIFSQDASTSAGIFYGSSTLSPHSIANNVIEGFSGTGGRGIDYGTGDPPLTSSLNNSVYNCSTPFTTPLSGEFYIDAGNETLVSSPFAKSGSPSYADRLNYFSLNDVGNVRTGSFQVGENLSRGAVQFAGTGTGATNVAAAKFTRLE